MEYTPGASEWIIGNPELLRKLQNHQPLARISIPLSGRIDLNAYHGGREIR
jgi:hypothetical protein